MIKSLESDGVITTGKKKAGGGTGFRTTYKLKGKHSFNQLPVDVRKHINELVLEWDKKRSNKMITQIG